MSRRGPRTLRGLDRAVVKCRECPRLVSWCEQVAGEPRASYAGQRYWGKPVPSFGDEAPSVLVVGLAPGAHGANRTGRMFTGDRSGDWLFEALHATGFASQPTSTSRRDGQSLEGLRISAVVHCAPPGNLPTTQERDRCRPFLERELRLCAPGLRVIVALGGFAWTSTLWALDQLEHRLRPRPAFGHGVEVEVGPWTLIGCFHPSQLNTFTGRLTKPMLREVFARARSLSGR